MSAPDTNVEKEEKRHKPALFGVKGSIVVVLLLFVGWLIWLAVYSTAPEGNNEPQIDDRTGEVEQQDTGAENTERALEQTTQPEE
ncbi:hypothetical protein E0K89_005715 [Aquicoccus sp. SCR17]|nr:hypothetical protein [Carideicomes alvinocaridis]